MSSWIISVPVWGPVYAKTFADVAAPALLAAVRHLNTPVRFIVHTNEPFIISTALPGQDIEVRAVAPKPTYEALQNGHIDAVSSAATGDRVVLLNADLTVSVNLLSRCAEHFASGKQAVVLLGIRTVRGNEVPPAGAQPRNLLAWAWAHRHRIIRDLEWGRGGSMLPTNLFWEAGESVVARGFHQHPVAIVKQESTTFRSTIDGDLLDCFPRDAIHVVTDPDDCAMCESSVPERRFAVRDRALTPALVAASMRTRASPMHCWLFEHRVVVRGTGDEVTDDGTVAREVLRLLEEACQAGAPAGPARTMRRGRAPA